MAEDTSEHGGVPWKNLAIWALGAILVIVGWELTRQITRADVMQLERWEDHESIKALQYDVSTVKKDQQDIKDTVKEMDRKQDEWREQVWPVIRREFGSSLTFPRGQQFDNSITAKPPRK